MSQVVEELTALSIDKTSIFKPGHDLSNSAINVCTSGVHDVHDLIKALNGMWCTIPDKKGRVQCWCPGAKQE